MNLCPKCWKEAARQYTREGNVFKAQDQIICPDHGQFFWPVRGKVRVSE